MKLKFENNLSLPAILFFIALFTFGSIGDVICIGDDGHLKVESSCQPCCSEIVDSILLITSTNLHDYHDNCYNCSDLELDGSVWNRQSTVSLNHYTLLQPVSLLSVDNVVKNNSKYTDKTHTYISPVQNQISVVISTTVLIC